jgi:probable rRNA maturation factor
MMPEPSGVEVLVNNPGSWQVSEARLKDACRLVLDSEEIPEAEVSVTLLADRDIQDLNQEYFKKDRPTDVIAFPLHGPGEPVLGDIYVGFEQAERQASDLGIPLDEELLRLTIHGTLHVLGYKHPEGEDRFEGKMFARQEELLRLFLEAGTG